MSPVKAINLVVIDDHEMVLDSLVRLLEGQRDLAVVGTGASIAEGLAAVERTLPDIVIMDYRLPDGNGAEAAGQVTTRWPDVRVIMLTGSEADGVVFDAARAGCSGFVEKTRAAAELVRMVRSVHAGVHEMPTEELSRLPHVDQLEVHYQPIVNLRDASILGFEALVRWVHPTRGLVAPTEFIPLAEQTSVIVDIGEAVRHVACAQAARWHREIERTPLPFMSVNVSGRELALPDFASRIRAVLEETGMEPTALVLEITETFFVGDSRENTRRLGELKDLGVRIALDDFGTAYSSLGYLRRFPIDVIKLDKSFTDDLPAGARGLRLLDAVGRLASEMGAVAEAEGIETVQQADCLIDVGWEVGQGFYYSRPVNADRINTMLRSA